MRTTRLPALLTLAVAALPGLAQANCYSIYDAKNQLAFQSTVAPIDLSTRISQAMRSRYPGGYLIMIPDDADCRELRTGATVSPRFDAGSAAGSEASAEQRLQAPLLRDTPSFRSDTATRDAVRSGNNLTIRR